MEYPYSDDYMRFDDVTKQYVLTETALMSKGINLRARLEENTTVIPDTVIENVVQTASDMIYQYIHMHNIDNEMQDYIIAKVPSARQVIYRAMLYQVMYVCNVGNLYLSKEKADRDAAIDVLAIQILNTTLPEVGRSVLYTGSWMRGAWCK